MSFVYNIISVNVASGSVWADVSGPGKIHISWRFWTKVIAFLFKTEWYHFPIVGIPWLYLNSNSTNCCYKEVLLHADVLIESSVKLRDFFFFSFFFSFTLWKLWFFSETQIWLFILWSLLSFLPQILSYWNIPFTCKGEKETRTGRAWKIK